MENKRSLTERIGHNLKTIRRQRGLSLEETARRTGVSKPMLGQIERGASNPTVSTLWKIASGLRVPFTAFIETKENDVTFIKKTELEPMPEDDGRYLVYPLFPMEGAKPFEMFSVRLLPGCHYDSASHPDGVEEQIWVENGNLTLHMENMTYAVHENEGVRFIANQPHSYINNASVECNAIMTIYYPQS
jgi:transcriptional regulator with XRE-family HTH domain